MTPLHFIFKSNNCYLISKCMCSSANVNLNSLNNEGKTPLAYCSYTILEKLGLTNGIVLVKENKVDNDNNELKKCRF